MKKDYFDDWQQYLSPDEAEAYSEILEWESAPAKKQGLFHRISMPIYDGLKKIPPEYMDAISNIVREILGALMEYSHLTINEEAISLKISLKCGQAMQDNAQAQELPVKILDETARECVNLNSAVTTITGGLSGAAGFGGFLLELPVLYGFLFRIIQETAVCYGYRIDTPEEKQYILKILELSHISSDDSRQNNIAGLHTLHTAIRGGVSLNQAGSLEMGIGELAKRIGAFYSRRTLLIGFMILGGLVGAGTNFILSRQVSDSAYNTYRKRFIMDRAMARRVKRI